MSVTEQPASPPGADPSEEVRRERRAVVGDVALAVFVLVTVATAILADLEEDARNADAVAYGFAVLLAVPMLGRRRWPVATLLVTVGALLGYYALGYPAIGLAAPLAAALYSTAERGRLRWAVGVAVGVVASTWVLRYAQGQDPGFLFAYELPVTATLMAAVIALGDSVRNRRRVEVEARRRLAQEAAEREREAQRRVGEERLRIAREVHDVVGHTVSVISLQADVAAEALAADDDASAQQAVEVIRASSRSAMGELRSTLAMLREDSPRAPTPGIGEVDGLVLRARDAGLSAELVKDGDLADLPVPVAAAAHRIVQESLTNVLRHADARAVRVELSRLDGRLDVRVRDDGHGGPVLEGAGGHGIAGMRERAVLLGGRLTAGPADGSGFEVRAWLPLELPAEPPTSPEPR